VDIKRIEEYFEEYSEETLKRLWEDWKTARKNIDDFEEQIKNAKNIDELLKCESGYVYGNGSDWFDFNEANGYAYLIVIERNSDGFIEIKTLWTGNFDYGENETWFDGLTRDADIEEIKQFIIDALDYYRECVDKYHLYNEFKDVFEYFEKNGKR